MSYLNIAAQAGQVAQRTKWDFWPFNSGVTGDWQTSLATYAFSAVILGVICLFLRLLYGPKGIWRDHDMDREAEAELRRERAELDADLRAGRINKALYDLKMKALDR